LNVQDGDVNIQFSAVAKQNTLMPLAYCGHLNHPGKFTESYALTVENFQYVLAHLLHGSIPLQGSDSE